MYAELTEAGVASTLVIVHGSDHGLESLNGGETMPTGGQIAEMLVAFIEEHLK